MTIAPLPLDVLATTAAADAPGSSTTSTRGSSNQGSSPQGASAGETTTPDAFAALVAAVLAAGAPTPADASRAPADLSADLSQAPVDAEPAHPDTALAPDQEAHQAEPAHPDAPGATPRPQPTADPARPDVALTPVLLPVVLPPALNAALAVSVHSTSTAATYGGERPTESVTTTLDHAPLIPSTPASTPAGGEQATGPAPSTVEHAPPLLAADSGGEQATDRAAQTVDHAPPAPAPGADQPRLTPSADPQAATFVQAPATTATGTADRPVTQVTRSTAAQVVPELTRLVQAGPGTHRMVLRLDPEHLGDVRITLTVHPGGVRVRMATGSEDARATLHEGLPALQRALESMTGRPAGETQLSVLHQSQATSQQAGQQSGQQAGHQAGSHADPSTYDGDNPPPSQTDAGASDHQTPGERPQAEHRAAGRPAGTQVDTTARDGSQGAGTPRPADPPTSDASRRLDVSM